MGNASSKKLDVDVPEDLGQSSRRRRRSIENDLFHINITGLTRYTNYTITVTAYNFMEGPATDPITVSTDESGTFVVVVVAYFLFTLLIFQ